MRIIRKPNLKLPAERGWLLSLVVIVLVAIGILVILQVLAFGRYAISIWSINEDHHGANVLVIFFPQMVRKMAHVFYPKRIAFWNWILVGCLVIAPILLNKADFHWGFSFLEFNWPELAWSSLLLLEECFSTHYWFTWNSLLGYFQVSVWRWNFG